MSDKKYKLSSKLKIMNRIANLHLETKEQKMAYLQAAQKGEPAYIEKTPISTVYLYYNGTLRIDYKTLMDKDKKIYPKMTTWSVPIGHEDGKVLYERLA